MTHAHASQDVDVKKESDEKDDDKSSVSDGIHSYRRRWYVLFVFSLLTATQGGFWNTWSPLATSAQIAFDWDTSVIALQENWGPIAYILSIVFFTWLIDVKGLRWACVVTAGLVFAGAGLRCITSTPPTATWLIHMGQLLNGLAGPVAMGGPPAVSAVWFPANQRVTATAIGTISNGFGVALSFIIGPLMVPSGGNNSDHVCNISGGSGHENSHNITDAGCMNVLPDCHSISESETKAMSILIHLHNSRLLNAIILLTAEMCVLFSAHIRRSIMRLMYIEFGWSAALFLLILVYFPAKPPLPPSITASIKRLDYKTGLKMLSRHRRFWILTLTYAVSCGVFFAWGSLIAINLRPFGVGEDEAGWVGFYASLVGNVAAMFVSLFADIFKRRLKVFLIVLYSLGSVFYILFALACIRVIPFHIVAINGINIAGSISLLGAIPLLYEFACETTYPIAEGLTNGVMTCLNNCVGLVFYLIMMAPMGTGWMNWAVVGSTVVCIPIFALYKEQYRRLDIDTETEGLGSTVTDDETARLINPSRHNANIQDGTNNGGTSNSIMHSYQYSR